MRTVSKRRSNTLRQTTTEDQQWEDYQRRLQLKRLQAQFAEEEKIEQTAATNKQRRAEKEKAHTQGLIDIDERRTKKSKQFIRDLDADEKRFDANRRQRASFNDFLIDKQNKLNATAEQGTKKFSLFGNAIKGALAGFVVGFIIGETIDLIGKLGQLAGSSIMLAAEFQRTTNAMTVFAGSTSLARKEIRDIDQIAANTPGLRMEDAEQGTLRLRALGFQADVTKSLVIGLAKQKLLSGADEQAMQRVIINLTQLASGSPRMTQDIREMVLAMPTLRGAILDTFGTFQKFQQALKEDPNNALAKFAEHLKNVESPTGGFIDALGKAEDAFTRAGRVFGEPLLGPLTQDLRDATGWLDRNANTWHDWGNSVSDVIRGVSDSWRKYLEFRKSAQDNGIDRAYQSSGAADEIGDGVLSVAVPWTVAYKAFEQQGREARIDEAKQNYESLFKNIEQGLSQGHFTRDDMVFDDYIAIYKDDAEKVERITNDKNTNQQLLEKDNQERLAAIEAEGLRKRYEVLAQWFDARDKMSKAIADQETAATRGYLQHADRSTPGRAASANAQQYQLDLAELKRQREQVEHQRFMEDLGGTLDDIKRSTYDSQLREFDAQYRQLIAARNAQLKEENKQRKEAMITGGRLSISTGDAVIDAIIRNAASSKNISPNILAAMIGQESRGKNGQTSWAGAGGLMQLMPGTARGYGVTNVMDPTQNIQGGAAYLSYLLSQTGGNLEWALAGYNSGRVIKSQAEYEKVRKFSNFKKGDKRRGGYGGSTGEYVDKIMKRLGGAIEVPTNVEFGTFDLGAESDRLTTNRGVGRTNDLASYLLANGIAPTGDTLQTILAQRIADAKATGKEQPELADIMKQYGINPMLASPELYAKGYNQTNVDAYNQLAIRRASFGSEVSQGKVAQDLALENQGLDLDKEYELLKDINIEKLREIDSSEKRNALQKAKNDLTVRELNSEEELANNIEQKRLDQANALLDVKRDLGTLEAQNASTSFVTDRRNLKVLQEQLDLKTQISDVEDQIANSGQNDELRITLALLQQQKDILDEHVQAMITIQTSQVDINRMMDIRADTIDAKILDHLAKQRNMTDAIADGVIGIYEGIAGPLEKGIDKLNKKLGPLGGLFGGIEKTVVRSFLTKATTGILGFFGLGGLADKVTTSSNPVVAGLQKQDKQIDLLKQIAINTGGGPGLGAIGVGGGGFRIPGLGGGSGLGNIFHFPGIGIGGTAPFNPGGSSSPYGGLLAAIAGLPPGGVGAGRGVLTGGPTPSGGFFGSILRLFGLGGGTNPDGRGGGLGGLLSGLGASAAALFSNPVTAIAALAPLYIQGLTTTSKAKGFAIAGVLGLIASIFNLNNRRKKEEKIRTQLWMSAADGMNKLISGVRSHQISPEEALSQAEQIKADYTQQVSQLKDKKTRRIAMQMWDPPNDLYNKMEELKRVADQSRADDARDKRILPEFADGGYIRARRGGMMAILGEGGHDEVVLSSDPSKANRTAGLLAGFLANYAPAQAVSSSGSQGPITIYVSTDIDAEGMVRTTVKTDGVRKEMVKVINEEIKNGTVKV
jgi:soluble lytic murein transglycosylase-like protein